MEFKEENTAMLSNFEVYQVLNEYVKEQKDAKSTRSHQNLSTITYETLKYMNDSPTALQNKECIVSVVKELAPYGLTKAEKLQFINLRPTSAVEVSLIIEENEERLAEEQIDEILDIISKLPAPMETEENIEE